MKDNGICHEDTEGEFKLFVKDGLNYEMNSLGNIVEDQEGIVFTKKMDGECDEFVFAEDFIIESGDYLNLAIHIEEDNIWDDDLSLGSIAIDPNQSSVQKIVAFTGTKVVSKSVVKSTEGGTYTIKAQDESGQDITVNTVNDVTLFKTLTQLYTSTPINITVERVPQQNK